MSDTPESDEQTAAKNCVESIATQMVGDNHKNAARQDMDAQGNIKVYVVNPDAIPGVVNERFGYLYKQSSSPYYDEQARFDTLGDTAEKSTADAFAYWTDSTITFVENPEDADIYVAGIKAKDTGLEASAVRPQSTGFSWDAAIIHKPVVLIDMNGTLYNDGRRKLLFVHEIGHALGLEHPEFYYSKDACEGVKTPEIQSIMGGNGTARGDVNDICANPVDVTAIGKMMPHTGKKCSPTR